MCLRDLDFPSMALNIYATPDAKIKVTGTNTLIYTWQVDSPVKEQQVYNKFTKKSRDLLDEFQRLSIQDRKMRSAPSAERNAGRAKRDSISAIIDKHNLELMQELPVSSVWLDKLLGLSMTVRYKPEYAYKEETLALYNRLNEKQKASPSGQEIATNLFPPKAVEEGDDMADADLFDLDGKIHHLADLKGKYILLDFWFRGCGACIMALPEMRELQEQYKERLTIVSLSSDTPKNWKAASEEHEMPWLNLNNLKQITGLYAKYGVRGAPSYVLISLEGKIMKMWLGYRKGGLKEVIEKTVSEERKVF